MTTIIIYAEGSRTYLKSMFPPQQAAQLISFLYNLATKLKLPSTLENYEMEQ
jgi:GH24 family phage-related lysozyme (muramidase)